jgi:DNA-binding NarL/FixJ family response regulator
MAICFATVCLKQYVLLSPPVCISSIQSLYIAMIRIIIADDRPDSIGAIVKCLHESRLFSIGPIVNNGYELVMQLNCTTATPDIIITDINMPIMDGIASNYFLTQQFPEVKIISLSAYSDLPYIEQVIESGAHGYLFKPGAETIILSAIETVLSNKKYIDNRIGIDERISHKLHMELPKRPSTTNFNLTPRESAFVILNATPLSYNQIAQLMFVEQKTIHTYFDRVAQKLHVNNRQALTLFSLQNGLAKLARYT